MDQLTWTGALGPFLNPVFLAALVVLVVSFLLQFLMALVGFASGGVVPQGDGTAVRVRTPYDWVGLVVQGAFAVALLSVLVYLVGGMLLSGAAKGIIGQISTLYIPVWISLIVLFVLSFTFKRRLGLYGKLFDSPIGMIGFGLVMFWVFTAIWADFLVTADPLSQVSGMKNKAPGTPVPGRETWYLLGGDNLARDVYSRMVLGAREVLKIAPAATLFAFMVGITLGLPSGYIGGRLDTVLTFVSNLVLAFPVILLFYLLVTPEIQSTAINAGLLALIALALVAAVVLWQQIARRAEGGLLRALGVVLAVVAFALLAWVASRLWSVLPEGVTGLFPAATIPKLMSGVLFLFPIIFLTVLFNSRFHTQPTKRNVLVALTLVLGFWVYLGLAFDADPFGLISMRPNILIVFVSVVFVNSPTVYRIVRGLALDIQTRDYVAAAQTRGEGPWYIMLWEILPNARGPLIVDFCLRIGYTTILLGTLGFFGLGVSPESPNWGSTINEGRKLLSIYPHPAVVPALALMSLVLGLNLLADGLREESLKD